MFYKIFGFVYTDWKLFVHILRDRDKKFLKNK